MSHGVSHKTEGHEATIRNVVGFAHEVRIHLYDSQIIFASVLPAAEVEPGAFVVRPWGLKSPRTVRYDEVSHAVPVKRMGWQKHRSIAVAQAGGVYEQSRAAGAAAEVQSPINEVLTPMAEVPTVTALALTAATEDPNPTSEALTPSTEALTQNGVALIATAEASSPTRA
jgi:hypothetical protein